MHCLPEEILCGKYLSDLQMLWPSSHIHSHEWSYSDKTVKEDHCPSWSDNIMYHLLKQHCQSFFTTSDILTIPLIVLRMDRYAELRVSKPGEMVIWWLPVVFLSSFSAHWTIGNIECGSIGMALCGEFR